MSCKSDVSRQFREDQRTMLAASHSVFCELGMIVRTGANNHELDLCVCEEVVCCAIMLCFGIVDGAVLSRLDSVLISRCFCTLQESVHFKISVWRDEGQVKTFRGKAVAHKPDFDWRHYDVQIDKDSQGLRRASLNLDVSYMDSGTTRTMPVVSRHRVALG